MPENHLPEAHPPSFACQRCGRELHRGQGDFYLVKILAVADPSPPEIQGEEDPGAEIQRLLKQLMKRSERELIDQVYQRRLYTLCASCYRQWIADPIRSFQ